MKRKTCVNKLMACFLAVMLILNFVPGFYFEVEATQSMTGNFSKSYSITGNNDQDMVAVAKAQLNKTGSNLGYTEQWCADFVSDCAKLAGIADTVIPHNYSGRGSCDLLYSYMVNNCSAQKVGKSQAKLGDIVFFGSTSDLTHVAIVESYTNSALHWIGGNQGSGSTLYTRLVSECNESIDPDANVVYVLRPNYAKASYDAWYSDMPLVNLGTDFYAFILNNNYWKPIASTDDNNVELQTENGNGNQLWRFVRQSDGSYIIYNGKDDGYNNFVLDSTGSDAVGNNVYVYNGYVESTAQQWYIYGTNPNLYFKSKCTDCVLDVTDNSNTDGANIQMYTYNGTNAQKFAVYAVDMYKVSFDANGGTCLTSSKKIAGESKYGDLPAPSRANYTFDGWYTAKSGGTEVTKTTKVTATANHTLYAHWTANAYKVAFNANGGTGTMNTQTLTYDQSANLTANSFTRTGYSFAGWNTKAEGSGTSYADKANVKNLATSGTVTLYAMWTASGYSVAFNSNGGTGTMNSQTLSYDQSANLTANSFTRTGYSFSGWNTKADGSGTSYADKASVKNLATSGTVTLYAKWTANKYTVNFDGNGADELSTASKEVTYNSNYGDLPVPQKSGYNFMGWYTAESGGTQITKDSKVTITANQTLYAQWSKNQFVVAFDAMGGTAEADSKLVTFGKNYGVLPSATRNNFEFQGWYTEDGIQITSSSIVDLTSNITLYAKWEIDDSAGDINLDGDVNVADAVLLQGYLLGRFCLNEDEWNAADLIDDGSVDAFDMVIMRRILIGAGGN